jgi:hypothetical protein
MCTQAYREALTREFSAAAPPAPGQRRAAEAGREEVSPSGACCMSATAPAGGWPLRGAGRYEELGFVVTRSGVTSTAARRSTAITRS